MLCSSTVTTNSNFLLIFSITSLSIGLIVGKVYIEGVNPNFLSSTLASATSSKIAPVLNKAIFSPS